jgi:hypothetical protein
LSALGRRGVPAERVVDEAVELLQLVDVRIALDPGPPGRVGVVPGG